MGYWRELTGVVIAAGIVSACAWLAAHNWLQYSSGVTGSLSTPHVRTVDQWRSAIAMGDCVAFVDCDWNGDVVAYRRTFASFEQWCLQRRGVKPVPVMILPEERDPLFQELQKLWTDYNIPQGGLKNYGGAGRIVWLREGRVVDAVWWRDAPEPMLIQRTTRNFGVGLQH